MTARVTVIGVGEVLGPELAESVRREGWDSASVPAGDRMAVAAGELVASLETEFVAFVSGSGNIAEGADGHLHLALEQHPAADVIYADEVIPGRGGGVVRKPIHSPERLRCQYYWGELVFVRRTTFVELGGFDSELRGAEAYDLALRATRSDRSIIHVAAPLFVRSAAPTTQLDGAAMNATRRALQTHLDATGGGEVLEIGADGIHDTRRVVQGEPLVSIVIPSRGIYSESDGVRSSYLLDGVRSVVEQSTYQNYEIVVVLDEVADEEVVRELAEILGDRLTIVVWRQPFNFSDKVNAGAIRARGEFVLLLNDDVVVLSPGWIESLLSLAQLPGAGMSGAMLYYDDDTIQHAGHHYYEDDASHIGLDDARGSRGPLDGYRVEREVSGVTAACAMVPIAVYREVGGLTGLLPGAFNDVDLCMKVTEKGFDIYWTPHAELYHFESKTRDASVHSFEVDVLWGRWGHRMHDPRYWPYPHSRQPQRAEWRN